MDHEAPTATLTRQLTAISSAGGTSYNVAVTFADNLGLYRRSLGDGDVELIATNGARLPGHLISGVNNAGRPPKVLPLTYRFTAPGGRWDPADNGSYRLVIAGNQVEDPSGNAIPASAKRRGLGTFAVEIPSGEVWGTVFSDADADGAKSKSERRGLAATLYLDLDNDGVYDPADDEPMTTSSPRSGNFAFLAVAPGTYALRQVTPADCRQTLPRKYYAPTVSTGDGPDAAWYLFGDTTLAYVAGTVYSDADGDGTRDGAEPPLAGRRVFVDLDGDGLFDAGPEPWALSGAAGLFALPAVPIGKSRLQVEPGRGYSTFSPAGGYRLRLTSGQVARRLDFGLR